MNTYETTTKYVRRPSSRRKKRRYRINKVKFIRFILICILFLSLVIWGITSIISRIYNAVIEHDSTATYETIGEVDVESIIPVTTVSANDNYIVEVNTYENKPDNLPETYYDYVINISEKEEVPSEVILAIMTTENELYDANARCVNTNGTVDMGLCQINSSYVEYFSEEYNIDNLDPYNIEDSITFVARHMKKLSAYGREKYNLSEKDSYIFAAGAYNRGLGNECKYRNMYEYKEKFIKYYEEFSF